MGKLAEAEAGYREVITLGMPSVGISQPVVLSAHRRLGSMLLNQGRYAEAVELLSVAEPEGRKAYTGANERSLALLLKELGSARAGLGQFAPAETKLLEAHAVYVRVRGEEHEETMTCARTLADFYDAWEKAEPGNGHEAQAAAWRARLPVAEPAATPSAESPR
jgi:hypothetical protein